MIFFVIEWFGSFPLKIEDYFKYFQTKNRILLMNSEGLCGSLHSVPFIDSWKWNYSIHSLIEYGCYIGKKNRTSNRIHGDGYSQKFIPIQNHKNNCTIQLEWIFSPLNSSQCGAHAYLTFTTITHRSKKAIDTPSVSDYERERECV